MAKVNKETISSFLFGMERFRPSFFLGSANSLVLFARYLKESSNKSFWRPKAIISSAEVLTESDRHLVEEVFEAKVYDRYACREASVLASECSCHQGMHINAESIHLEFIRGNRKAKPGEVGEIIMTDLRNLAMPLIRYRIGDAGIPSDQSCRCGRGLPLMGMAAGRVTDFLVTSEGDLVSGCVLTVNLITKVPKLSQIQFYQDKVGKVLVKVVFRDTSVQDSVARLRELISHYLGKGTQIELLFVDEIPTEPSGKYRFTVSTLDPLQYVI
jgi:phenylacetate-CoA ligase